MSCISRNFAAGLCVALLLTIEAVAQDPALSLEAVKVNGEDLAKTTSNITVGPGDSMELNIFVRDWSPNGEKLRALQVQIDDRGYTSGTTGSIHPVDYEKTTLSEFENKQNAFIDVEHPRYVFKGATSMPVMDTISWGYRYLNIVVDPDQAVPCSEKGARYYCGTLKVKVSDDASGTFILGLYEEPGASTLRDENNVEIMPLSFDKLVVNVTEKALVRRVVSSEPPAGAVDARDAANGGWDRIDLTFNIDATALKPDDFTLTDGSSDPPKVKAVEANGTRVTLRLERGLRPARWTDIMHKASSSGTRIGCLPGDASGDGVVNAEDVFLLARQQSAGELPLPLYRTDVDRNGTCDPADAIRLIELVNEPTAYRTRLP